MTTTFASLNTWQIKKTVAAFKSMAFHELSRQQKLQMHDYPVRHATGTQCPDLSKPVTHNYEVRGGAVVMLALATESHDLL